MANKPHKHAEVIKAWADGAEIEFFDFYKRAWATCSSPLWCEKLEYRIKPSPKKTVGYRRYVYQTWNNCLYVTLLEEDFDRGPEYIENQKTFVKWIDLEWQYEDVVE